MLGIEHLLFVLTTFAFPPVALTVLLCIILATFGKSLGLRQMYVDTLINIFEWGARQIKTTEKIRRKESAMNTPFFYNKIAELEDDEDDELKSLETPRFEATDGITDDDMEIEMRSDTRSETESRDSGEDFPSVDSDYGDESCLKRKFGSTTSLASVGSCCSLRNRKMSESSTLGIIKRETQIYLDDNFSEDIPDEVFVRSRGWAAIRDSVDFVKAGMEAIIEDEVTSRFEAEQLVSWNMLTRTSIKFYQFVNWKLSALWIIGFLFRYCVMLPLRFTIFCIGLIFLISSTALIGLVPVLSWKKKLNHKCMLICYRILSRSLTAVVYFHDEHYKAEKQGICVANHTSPIDALILSIDNVYALIGQKHDGLLGIVQRALSRASSHIWFERSEAKDRHVVAQKLREHCTDPDKLPILIFPEGTCINNTSVMMFKKGSFEIETTIYPIAMKYDSRFGDAFWNSSEQSWCGYIMRMMTSWAIICNVWYLPPMTKRVGEDAVDFANRVKKEIANKGGLVDLEWDGGLKRAKVPPKMVAKQQERYANRLSRYTSVSEVVKHEDVQVTLEMDKTVSGYASLEDLPEDVFVDEEDETFEVEEDIDENDENDENEPDSTIRKRRLVDTIPLVKI
ncbi:CRE-ACL-4 protein [Caenorhabditis remanei]|uniref:CRE-ACL-4 protein n=1 Tax=Caenorhabditis remanei TaxID=31234 RepID=E3LCS0_CAERE|nr:CRE-ACL-4 protein [Caenorhabditis remanei]